MALLIASRVAGLACVLAAVKAYVCDLSEAVPIPSNAFPTEGLSPGGLLHAAAVYVSGPALEETSYSYTSLEDGVKMIFDTDCSCFLDYLASIYIPSAYVQVPPDDTVSPPVPRARSWTNFFLSLAPDNQYWALIAQVPLIVAGDVFAYELPPGSKDTGHVMVAINQTSTSGPVVASSNPYPDLYSGAFWVYVADASSVIHQNDTRGPGQKFANGVGRGFLRVFVNASAYPVAFQFTETDGVHAVAMAAGRPLRFSGLDEDSVRGLGAEGRAAAAEYLGRDLQVDEEDSDIPPPSL